MQNLVRPELVRAKRIDHNTGDAKRGPAPIEALVVQDEQEEGVGIGVEQVARPELISARFVKRQ